ncbi:MAG: hypothetical protein HYW90_01160 [Candidatus Sungbacteria bacterium]|nr:hypothetical protein [Candidatus Sungbacteria bacterium]
MANQNFSFKTDPPLVEKSEESERGAEEGYLLPASVVISAVILVGAWLYTADPKSWQGRAEFQPPLNGQAPARDAFEEKVLPSSGIILPVRWGDLGVKMVSVGVIDGERFKSVYASRGGLSDEYLRFLERSDNGNIKITPENSGFLLNLFWALGLGNKNDVLDRGPMVTYDGRAPASPEEALAKAANFASTGGWTLAKGDAMDHYSRHPFVVLTPLQQKIVERVSKNIYRPCCNNPTHFPDCNHGMAMLGLLELLASQGVSENEMYKVALQVNAYWFPGTYLTIAKYLEMKGVSWGSADPKEVLGARYSSASGYRQILNEITPAPTPSGGGCGV